MCAVCVSFGASVVPSVLVPLIVQQCDRYKGNMAHGKRDGSGVYTFSANSSVYTGNYSDNARQGEGEM